MSIESVVAEGRLIRNDWSRIEDGKQLLCMYTAMMNNAEDRPMFCPSEVCPSWLAHLIPFINDNCVFLTKTALRIGKLVPFLPSLDCKNKVILLTISYIMKPESDKLCDIELGMLKEAIEAGKGMGDERHTFNFDSTKGIAGSYAYKYGGHLVAAFCEMVQDKAGLIDEIVTLLEEEAQTCES